METVCSERAAAGPLPAAISSQPRAGPRAKFPVCLASFSFRKTLGVWLCAELGAVSVKAHVSLLGSQPPVFVLSSAPSVSAFDPWDARPASHPFSNQVVLPAGL